MYVGSELVPDETCVDGLATLFQMFALISSKLVTYERSLTTVGILLIQLLRIV